MRIVCELSNDDLADEICTWSGRLAAGMAHLLTFVREFDRREAWAGPGMLSCAHWLAWRVGLSPGTAREWVRVARRLETLPELAAAFATGGTSWSQVRAVTRVAEPDDGVDWVDLARHSSAAQLEQVVRGIRRVRRIEEVEADPELAAWKMRTRHRYDDHGNLVITIHAPAQHAPVILAALEAQRAELDRQQQARSAAAAEDPETAEGVLDVPAGTSRPHNPEPSRPTSGDALLAMARTSLDVMGAEHPEIARRNRSQLVVHVDPLSGWSRLPDGELLPPSCLTTAMATFTGPAGVVRLRPLSADDLTAHDLGRTAREVSLPLRELLGSLDGERCRFPGCTRRAKLHAHHVEYWSAAGPTDLANLVLLCSRHHTLVHQHGFQLALRPDRSLQVHTAEGTPVLHQHDQPWGDPGRLDPTGSVSAGTATSIASDSRMDLGYVVSVLLQQAA